MSVVNKRTPVGSIFSILKMKEYESTNIHKINLTPESEKSKIIL